jgi:hypothetical protein
LLQFLELAIPRPPRDIWRIRTNNSSEMPMPEGDVPAAWDFRTLLLWWNLFALPALLLAAAALVVIKNRRLDRSIPADIDLDGRRLVKILALMHLVISVQAVVRLTQELLTMREMGVTESFENLIGQTISVVVNPLLALGFWRAWRAARWMAFAWYVLLSVIGVIVTVFRLRFPVAVDPLWWADYFAGRLMPLFLLFVLFLPRVKRVFARPKVKPEADVAHAANEPEPARSPRWSIISVFALLCLIVVISNLAVDTADWVERSISASNDLPPEPGEIE